MVVPKKNGKLRMCVDYIPLNCVTAEDAYPPPLIPDIFASFHGKACFLNLDLFSGYYQVAMSPDSIGFTSFVSKFGQFKFLRMPFGRPTHVPAHHEHGISRPPGRLRDSLLGRYHCRIAVLCPTHC